MEIKNKLNIWSNVDHMYKRVKKKKCKKNIFYLIFLISISLLAYYRSPNFVVFAKINDKKKNVKLDNTLNDTPNNESINKENNKLDNETNNIKENNLDSKINENAYNTNNKIRNELLFQSFNIRSFEEERYKLKFVEKYIINNSDLFNNDNLIFDTLSSFYNGFIDSYINPPIDGDNKSLPLNDKDVKINEIKKLIILKFSKYGLVLFSFFLGIKLFFSLFQKLVKYIFILILKIFKFCCCGGQ
ncbi:conserved Plasmodium protein, unknown function [Plasmodium berghei]|uniref:Uncharacterized protein n=2 Tax=Plasmodium berghei TaxID=5821 RepID=A0A509ALT3_PLABA|nr:conserved Plasmodium protein, unknown function [Plasmodium berghei ANKA]CXI75802.1 conserved Plasmodium protein, unknown function [Plasmodium berghei]SCM24854.1 conserved Plasmodium protein, unknown function [Plasmodium berghei]SCN27189.1 conserved Plasmodium protein, unknown function [Plasmodium berghei]SCO61744.1 conserved Plasmodium protein, unknown function [Plasmodium berghei]SCO63612.1 conserved Plasmodium protein, unknown function [Plasmodium berghei]|eukprot:XP_034422823.1 conserved Plasmodium protein, unknown function [Plasmodium berghei ANKA]